MKGIILAAGRGTRLSKYTRFRPKGMLKFNGMSLLEYQINTMRQIGIEDIVIVKGYMKDKINFKDIEFYVNDNFEETNMVESLFCAVDELEGECIITYSDIIYENHVLNQSVESKCDIGVVVDKDFENYWVERLGNDYQKDLESLVIENGKITSLGELEPDESEICARYVGIIKLSEKGAKSLKDNYLKFKDSQATSKWENRIFEKWHMTDLLQGMIDEGCIIEPITISRGWLEFDTDRDYELYRAWLKNNHLENFIKL